MNKYMLNNYEIAPLYFPELPDASARVKYQRWEKARKLEKNKLRIAMIKAYKNKIKKLTVEMNKLIKSA